MTRSLQSRVLALAGIGVFAASAALSMLSRQSLLAIEASAAREQARAASVAARAVGRDVLADFEALQGAVSAPGIQEPAVDFRARESALSVALQRFRLADAACFTDHAGVAGLCTPAEARTRFLDATMIGTARDAIGNRRPLLSSFVGAKDTREAVLVVPLSDGSGAAMGIVDANGSRLAALLPRGEGTALSSPGTGLPEEAEVRRSQAPVEGTPWVVTMVEPASGEIAAFRRRSLWLGPSLTLLAVLLAWGVVLSVQRPVRTLTDAAERIAAGDLSRPIAGGNDEIGRLAAALEHMRARLRRSIESVEQANAVLEQRVRERTAQLMRVLRTVISAQEDERRRVARELHDETSQLVAAMAISLDAGMPSPPPPWLADVRRLVDRMHDGLHRVIVNLRPSVLDDLGLAAAIEWLAEHQLRHAGIMARCELSELQECRADTATEIALFRVVQEAVTNIVRHADASSVLIQGGLTESASGRPGSRLWIEVEDDGCGFEPASVSADAETLRGVGLLGMHERMELIGGTLQIDSAPGEGTRIRVEAPVHIGEEVFA